MAGFLILSNPIELRSGRWLKIAISLPLVLGFIGGMSSGLNARGGLILISCIVALAFVWCANLSWFFAGSFANFFYSDISSPTGIRSDFRYAKIHRRDGELEQAVAAIEHELKKEPENFEGLILLAGVYNDMKQPEKAMAQLEIVSNAPGATEAQKEVARGENKRCEQLKRHLATTRGKSRP